MRAPSFELRYIHKPASRINSTHEIEPGSGNTWAAVTTRFFLAIFPAQNASLGGNSAGASSVTPKVTPKIAGG